MTSSNSSSAEVLPVRALIVRPVGDHEFEFRVVPVGDIDYYRTAGWQLVAYDPADEVTHD